MTLIKVDFGRKSFGNKIAFMFSKSEFVGNYSCFFSVIPSLGNMDVSGAGEDKSSLGVFMVLLREYS